MTVMIMKNYMTWALLLVVGLLMASNRAAAAGPPEQLIVWSDSNNLIVVQQEDSGYVGLNEGGTHLAWNFKIDDWTGKHIKLTGISMQTQFDGSHQMVIVEGKPDVIKNGIAYCKVHYSVGKGWKSRKIKVTWDVPTPNLTGLWIR